MLAAKIIKELIKKLLKYKVSMYMVNYITKDIIEQFLKKICQNGGKNKNKLIAVKVTSHFNVKTIK